MNAIQKKRFNLERRHRRVRRAVIGSPERPRLCVHRSVSHIYAQLVDDSTGRTLLAVNTLQEKVAQQLKSGGNIAAAQAVGREMAAVAKAQGIQRVCFDRGGRKYHGRIKALAEAAREAGLQF